ncbi:MAG TPA: hypothetical protein VIC60_11115 [Thermomicrobiales bacterium]
MFVMRVMVHGLAGAGYGVYGDVIYGGTGIGVAGFANSSFGVLGSSASAIGVQGQITAGSAANTIAVKGLNQSTGAGGVGVRGECTNGTGVYGATSTGLYGVYGIAGSHQGAGGVVGVATVAGTIGFAGAAFAPATDAGYFTGNVSVFGNFGVSGSKFAVVKGADNKYRGMYAVESPECWFEDFGKAKMVNGAATVKIDPLFAQHVHADDYHVFLTEYDQNNALHVTNQTASGFTVQADEATLKAKGKQAAAVSGVFSWRVVAKRNDIKGDRLPVWEMPTPAFTKPEPPPPMKKP